MSYWADQSEKVVAQVMSANPDVDRKAMKKLLSDAYPFGPREMSPYKTWLKKVKGALDLKYGYEMSDYERKTLAEIRANSTQGELL